MTTIRQEDHPDNREPSGVLVTTGAYKGRDIFRHNPRDRGEFFIACLPDGMCLPGTYATKRAAEAAQDAWFATA